MAWAFQPINNLCIDCNIDIDPCAERNYILWQPQALAKAKGSSKPKTSSLSGGGVYRRQCAKCHDKQLQRPYERRKSSDSLITGFGVPPDHT